MADQHTTTARAHPNIALVKYWGKQDKPGNIPATPNLSITLSGLYTETRISTQDTDEFWLNGRQVTDSKVQRFLAALRNHHSVAPLKIESSNNFPTGAGLASSASGFAALITAINSHAHLGLNAELMSEWARQGSASAARSLFAGYVALVPPLWRAQQFAPAEHWPLAVVVAITSRATKDVSSTKGMEISRKTSPYYNAWLRSSGDDFARASDAITQRDFSALADVAELSCLKMHSVMLTSSPTLSYWNEATLACMDCVRELRSGGCEVFFTIDAGPQIKAVCIPDCADQVNAALQAIPGVQETMVCGLGPAAHVLTE
ncbi:MAG: diphosphomevalonate decarboxylase [Pseudomonadota bacterium]